MEYITFQHVGHPKVFQIFQSKSFHANLTKSLTVLFHISKYLIRIWSIVIYIQELTRMDTSITQIHSSLLVWISELYVERREQEFHLLNQIWILCYHYIQIIQTVNHMYMICISISELFLILELLMEWKLKLKKKIIKFLFL